MRPIELRHCLTGLLLQCSVRRPFSASPSHASLRSGGVKGFDEATYARYRPVLAARQSGTTFPLLPEPGGLHLTRLGDPRPRKY